MNDTNKNKKNDDINNINIDNNNNNGLIHVKKNPNYNARPICKYYKKGYCLYNEKCRYTHIKNSYSGIKDADSNNQNIVRNSSKQTSYDKYNHNNATNPRSQYNYDKNKYNNIYPNVKNRVFYNKK